MKKRILTIVVILALMTPAVAQIYVSDDDFDGRRTVDPATVGAFVPEQDIIYDQYYAPIGGELMLLTGFGIAYLLGKRRKNENH